MAFFRRRMRRFRKYQPPSSWPEPTVEETVDEAILISNVAVRLALKNLIIVRALQHRADYSAQRLRDAVETPQEPGTQRTDHDPHGRDESQPFEGSADMTQPLGHEGASKHVLIRQK